MISSQKSNFILRQIQSLKFTILFQKLIKISKIFISLSTSSIFWSFQIEFSPFPSNFWNVISLTASFLELSKCKLWNYLTKFVIFFSKLTKKVFFMRKDVHFPMKTSILVVTGKSFNDQVQHTTHKWSDNRLWILKQLHQNHPIRILISWYYGRNILK